MTATPPTPPEFSRRRFLAALVGALSLGPCLLAAPTRAGQQRTSTATIGGMEYLDLGAYLQRQGFRLLKAGPDGVRAELGGRRIVFEPEARDFEWNGVRLYAGDVVRVFRAGLWMSRIDVSTLLEPLLGSSSRTLQSSVRTICLDPGHGGKDPGTQNRRLGLMEKVFTLDLGQRLARLLQADGYRVVMTRTDDRFVDLEDRPVIAKRAKADVFISLHFNATESGTVAGTEQFILTPRNQRSTSSPAASASDRIELPGHRFNQANARLGYAVHRRIVGDLRRPDRGLRRARFAVLRTLECPGLLVEGAYLSNTEEARLVQRPEFRARLAEALRAGIGDWTGRRR